MSTIEIGMSGISCLATVICAVFAIKTYYKVDKIEKSLEDEAFEHILNLPEIEDIIQLLEAENGNLSFMTENETEEYYDIAARENVPEREHMPIFNRYRFYKKSKELYLYDVVNNNYKRIN